MTNEEAIKLLTNATYSEEWQGNEDLTEAQHMALDALEKQILKKVEKNDWGEQTNVCPNCHNYLDIFQFRCIECGQMIDWEDYE